MRKWRSEHQEQIKANRRAHYLAHRQEQIDVAVLWTKNHREIDRAKSKKFRETHPNYSKEYARKYYWEKQREDIHFRLKGALRARLRKALKYNLKTGSAVRELGCSVEELYNHLELSFTQGMSWDNWGEWHIDHVKPLASFDLTDIKQFKQAVHYTNLQPLWAIDNLRKGAREQSS